MCENTSGVCGLSLCILELTRAHQPFPADSLLVKEPVALLKANRVWGALRGKFRAVSLSLVVEYYHILLPKIKQSKTIPP